MARAADRLAVSRPVISKAITTLEATLGVRLLDRITGGVEPTAYGAALVARSRAMFDEMRRGIEEIAFLADPAAGTLRIGCTEVTAAGVVAVVLDRLALRHPRAAFDVEQGSVATSLRLLHLRQADLVVSRIVAADPEVELQALLQERLVVVCGASSPWGRRKRPVTLAELAGEPWIQSRAEIEPGGPTFEAFAALGLPVPPIRVISNSLNLRYGLLERGNFLTMIPETVLRLGAPRARLRVLPLAIPRWRFATAIATLKGRTLPPLARLFVAEARAVANELAAAPGVYAAHGRIASDDSKL